MSLTPEQFEQKLTNSADEFAKIFNNAPFVAVKDVEGAIKERIFTKGQDISGSQIGTYKEGKYKQKRVDFGRQVGYVDLQFSGDLIGSIVPGTRDNKAVVEINNSDEQKIAGFLTEKYNPNEAESKMIFQPSEKESAEAKELMINFIQEEIKKVIASWR